MCAKYCINLLWQILCLSDTYSLYSVLDGEHRHVWVISKAIIRYITIGRSATIEEQNCGFTDSNNLFKNFACT
jgi:hypothetical protein